MEVSHFSRLVAVHHSLPVGHGQVPHQAVLAQHRRHHLEAGRPDRRRLEDQVFSVQQLEGQFAELGEETNVRTASIHTLESADGVFEFLVEVC